MDWQVRKGKDFPPHMRGKFHVKMRECPNVNNHVYGPDGYGDSTDWADEMMKTHEQKLCQCGFYCLWEKKVAKSG